ncbi:hypothetical protein HYT02_03065 [Candidatus Gottesmanbacteria bacterium]|nr:hypothetical protein [Candidatus Gottesmanbacteria bacterium]
MTSIIPLLRRLLILFIILSAIFFIIQLRVKSYTNKRNPFWKVQSIDAMKYTRDIAREKIDDPSFDDVIKKQINQIADTGATHIAIATPYDDEFIPYLARWIDYARKKGLKIWFRGNFSGWEGWFSYPKITREEHIEKTKKFILTQRELFKDGDVFTSCPECENGGPGDPRRVGDIEGYRQFLITEHNAMVDTFKAINKDVDIRMNSSNGDVIKLIMDENTTDQLGGIISVDHYVKTPRELNEDINNYALITGGQVVLGEWGVPIPDIHQGMSEDDQAQWIDEALKLLIKNPNLYGLNYWVNVGGSTRLWNDDGRARAAVDVLTKYYNVKSASIRFLDGVRRPVVGASFDYDGTRYITDKEGFAHIRSFDDEFILPVEIDGYKLQNVLVNLNTSPFNVILRK